MLSYTAKTYRKAYTGLSRSTWLLSTIMLINRSGTMVIPFMTLYLTSPAMGYTIGQAGFVFGLFGAGAFFGAYFGGKLTDKIGFYPVQMITLTGGGVLFIILGLMKTFPLICAFTFLLSFVNEAFRPANSTAIAAYSREENRTRSYSLNRLAVNLGWATGSALGGILAKHSYQLLFWVDGITNISAALLMWFFLNPPVQAKEVKTVDTIILQRSAYRDKTYLLFILLVALFGCCFFQFFTNLPIYLKKEWHFTEPFIGSLMAMNGLIITVIEMAVVYNLERKGKNVFFITVGVVLAGTAYFTLNIPWAGHSLAVAMIILITFGEIFSMPFMNSYWISRTQHGNQGQYAALYTMAWSAAQTLGPMAGAQVAQRLGFNWLWWLVGSLSFFVAGFFYRFYKKNRV
ncbi:MAG: MFS transporter [Bacteroidetes bacterium]|nr:MFS transporter [Bacteroidota bacterium]